MNNIEQYGPPIMLREENAPLSRTLNAPPPSPLFMHSPNKGGIADFQYPPSYFVPETPRTPARQGIKGARRYTPFGRAADLTGVPLEGALQLLSNNESSSRSRSRTRRSKSKSKTQNHNSRNRGATYKRGRNSESQKGRPKRGAAGQSVLTNFFEMSNGLPTQYNTQGRPI